MSLTAPPPPTDVLADRRSIDDLVIQEARRRARRRRLAYALALALALAAVVGIAAVVAPGGGSSTPHPPPVEPSASIPAVAGGGPLEGAQLVASWGVIQAGWVLVYSDGTVILKQDLHSRIVAEPSATPPGGFDDESWPPSFWQRRLTARGLTRVQSGTMLPSRFVHGGPLPKDTWADPAFRPYNGTAEYAVCGRSYDGHTRATAAVLAQLPAPAQTLLRGTERTYRNLSYNSMLGWNKPGATLPLNPPPVRPDKAGCFELTASQTRALVRMSDRSEGSPGTFPEQASVSFTAGNGAKIELTIVKALPDRIFVALAN